LLDRAGGALCTLPRGTAIIVLALYALLAIMRNMVVGIPGAETSVRASALAMGTTRQQILWRVEIPLALP
jgi:osmoprotectant transport system permease protein